MEPELSSSIRGAPKPSSSRRKEREPTLRCGKGRVSSFLVFPLVNECVFTKTSGKPGDLPLLFESSGHCRSPTQAKNKAEIAGRKNYFFDCPDPITQTPAQSLWRRMQTPFRRIPMRERIRECITRWDGARRSAGLHAITKETRSFKFPPIASRVTPSSSPGWFWRLTQKVGYPNDLAPAASHPAKAAKRIWAGFKPKASRPI